MGLSLYIHYPFCANLCSYCDFYKIPFNTDLEREYFRALNCELILARETIDPENRSIDTIYIGGGTPSLIDLSLLETFIGELSNCFRFSPELEFTFEINPESIDSEKLLRLKELGINRPVFGIQSFNLKKLKKLGRKHLLNDSFRAMYLVRATGFDNFGVDMIFGLPRQTSRQLSDDLDQVIDLAPPHISYYQLTVEKGTPLAEKVAGGKLKLPGADLSAAMYRAINEELRQNSYFRYEVSSFALPGYECRHNMRYWEGGDFLGLGPSAHSFIGNHRFANEANLRKYLDCINNGKRPLICDTEEKAARMTETIMLGLRTSRGVSKTDFLHRFGRPVEQVIDRETFTTLVARGMIDPEGDYIRLTESGIFLADEIVIRLIK